ncbi:NUDIX hydrolase, partial [Fangia hongkongensis]
HLHDTISWVESGEQIFRIRKPNHPNKHLVSYFVVFDETCKKVLLVDHRNAELWLPSGGHVELNEDPADTVKRECQEELKTEAIFWHETPIFITQTLTVGKTAGHIDVSLWYVIKGSIKIDYQYDRDEFLDIQWFDLNNIPYERTDPHMKRFINKFTQML